MDLEFWKRRITKLLNKIKNYPNIGIVVSCRSDYLDLTLNSDQRGRFCELEHTGFYEKSWDAIHKIFAHYELPLPSYPPINMEFQNPLFLILFCEGQKKLEKKDFSKLHGHVGATYIFETFVNAVCKEIENKYGISSNGNRNLWNTVIKPISAEMVKDSSDRIAIDKFKEILSNSHPKIDPGKLMGELEAVMVLTLAPARLHGSEHPSLEVRFPFQRFGDHLISRYIFTQYKKQYRGNINLKTAKQFFSARTRLGK